jgi:hypothetical protein
MTSRKDNPLVDAPIVSPLPVDARHATLLAGWNYGLGRSVAFTSDAGHRWAGDWTGWADYDKFFAQIVRWSMRPTVEGGKFTAAADVRDGRVRLVVTALDTNDEFLNFLDISAALVDPEMKTRGVTLEQTAPGRYVGEFEAAVPGSYFATVVPGGGGTPFSLGVNVPYSAEFRDLETNSTLLESLASLEPRDGQRGRVINVSLENVNADAPPPVDTFRRTLPYPFSITQIWPLLLVIAACAFFADVFVRRVTVDFTWLAAPLAAAVRFVLRREAAPQPDERIARLRSRKQEIDHSLDQQRAAARFEPQADALPPLGMSVDDLEAAREAPRHDSAAPTSLSPATAEEDDYTSRLLKAKQRIRRQHRPED